MKVLVQSFCGIWSAKKNSKYSMKLISYFQNRPIPIKVKPCFTDTRLVRKAYHCRQFAWSLGKESCNLSLINSTCSIYFIYFILLFCHTQWITSRIKTIINRLINIKFKICTLLARSDCGGEISEKPSLWGIEISPHGQFKYSAAC